MNDLLSGLASAQGKPGGGHGGGDQCGGGNLGGIFGGGSIIWIIILLFLCGGLGHGEDCGTVCACKPKHCKELCKCGSSSNNGGLFGGFGGLGSGNGCWWIIILVFLFACGNQNKDCRPKNIDCCDE